MLFSNLSIVNNNINNSFDFSNDNSINEEKRIEIANNLFDNSLTVTRNSNINNNDDISSYSINTINYEKRKEAADKLFQSQSDISSRLDNWLKGEISLTLLLYKLIFFKFVKFANNSILLI